MYILYRKLWQNSNRTWCHFSTHKANTKIDDNTKNFRLLLHKKEFAWNGTMINFFILLFWILLTDLFKCLNYLANGSLFSFCFISRIGIKAKHWAFKEIKLEWIPKPMLFIWTRTLCLISFFTYIKYK